MSWVWAVWMESKLFQCFSSYRGMLSFSWLAAQFRIQNFFYNKVKWFRTHFFSIPPCWWTHFCFCLDSFLHGWCSSSWIKDVGKSTSEFCTFFVTSGERTTLINEMLAITITLWTKVNTRLPCNDWTLLHLVHKNRRRTFVEISYLIGTRKVPGVVVEKSFIHKQLLWKRRALHVSVMVSCR